MVCCLTTFALFLLPFCDDCCTQVPLQQGPRDNRPLQRSEPSRRGCFELMPLVAPVAPIPDPFEERKDIRNSSSNIRRARGQRGRVGAGESQHELATGSSGSAAPGLTRVLAQDAPPRRKTRGRLAPPHAPAASHAVATPTPGWARRRRSASPPRTRARSRPSGRPSSPRCSAREPQ